jgi:RNA polymerase sigma-70 factor, ECF subfamily
VLQEEPWHGDVSAAVAGCTRVTLADALAHVGAAIAAGASATHAADLALAFAVGRGDPVAVRRFDDQVAPEIAAAARAIDRDPGFVDEVCQRTRVRLVVGDGGDGGDTAPRIASYRGAGPLRAWVAIAARRMALNAKRDARPDAGKATQGDDVLADIVDREPDPELRHLKALYRAEFREALGAALAGLADRPRAVLRLRFVDGLELAQIGRLYRVHESTTSRWIAAALDEVGSATRKHLVARLAITADTADSVARMVQSGLDLSVARLLR